MKPFTNEFIYVIQYNFCMLVQIFVYFWFGNQIIIESMDVGNAVYAMDWTQLSARTQKNLLVIMIRSGEPMRFTNCNVIVLSLNTFISTQNKKESLFAASQFLIFDVQFASTNVVTAAGRPRSDERMLSLALTILTYIGLWKPVGWSHNWKSKCYNTYTFVVVILLYSFCVFDTINLCHSIDNREELTNTLCLLMSFLSAFYKALSILRKRENVINLESILRNEECRPHDFQESAIQNECDRDARILTAWYTVMSLAACWAMIITTFLEDFPERKMPFKSWLPYSYSSSIQFLLGFLYTSYTALVFVSAVSGVDSLIFCLMLNTCAQLKILKHRLLKMPQSIGAANSADGSVKSDRDSSEIINFERKMIAECIRHQCNIFQFAEMLNDNFTYVIFVQFTTSSIVLCLSVLELTKFRLLSSSFMFMLSYLAIMTVQVFLFCWYGDKVIVQSIDVAVGAYEMDWITLSNGTKKYLLMIIARSLKPIKFTSGHIIVLCIDSYNSLVKLSYSIYNVLSQPTET